MTIMVGRTSDADRKTVVMVHKEIEGTSYMCRGAVLGVDDDSAFRTTAVRVCTSLERAK